jgi:hypothetical protein
VIAYLPLILIFSVGWFLNDPVSLIGVAVASIFTLLTTILEKSQIRFLNLGSILLILLFLCMSVSTIYNKVNLEAALLGLYQHNFGLILWLILPLIYNLIRSNSSAQNKLFNFTFPAMLLFSVLYGTLQVYSIDPLPWTNQYDAVQLTLGNPNFASSLIGMLLIVPISEIFQKKNRLIFNLLLVAISIFVMYNCKSLQGFFVMIISIIVYFATKNKYLFSKNYTRLSRFLFYILFMLFSIVAILFWRIPFFQNLKAKIFYEGNIEQRLDYWRTGLSIFNDNVVLGVGPDQLGRFSGLYRDTNQVIRDGEFVLPDKSHNLLIDIFANGGIFAGLFFLGFITYIFCVIFKKINVDMTPSRRDIFAKSSAIWSGYLFQALISPDKILLLIIGISCAAVVVSDRGVDDASSLHTKNSRDEKEALIVKIVATCLIIPLIFFWNRSIATDYLARKIIVSEGIDVLTMNRFIQMTYSPKVTEEILVKAVNSGINCYQINQIASRLIIIDDRSAQGWFARAICQNQKKDFGSALSSLEQSLKFDPLNPTYLSARVKLAIASDEKKLAENYLSNLRTYFPEHDEIEKLQDSINLL